MCVLFYTKYNILSQAYMNRDKFTSPVPLKLPYNFPMMWFTSSFPYIQCRACLCCRSQSPRLTSGGIIIIYIKESLYPQVLFWKEKKKDLSLFCIHQQIKKYNSNVKLVRTYTVRNSRVNRPKMFLDLIDSPANGIKKNVFFLPRGNNDLKKEDAKKITGIGKEKKTDDVTTRYETWKPAIMEGADACGRTSAPYSPTSRTFYVAYTPHARTN